MSHPPQRSEHASPFVFRPECSYNPSHLERHVTRLRCNRHRHACQWSRPGRQSLSAWRHLGRMRLQPALPGVHGQSTAVTDEPVSSATRVHSAASQRRLSVEQSTGLASQRRLSVERSTELAGQARSFARPLGERAGEAGSDAAQSMLAHANGLGACAGSTARTNEGR